MAKAFLAYFPTLANLNALTDSLKPWPKSYFQASGAAVSAGLDPAMSWIYPRARPTLDF
ncbi:MAG: hypothetical protein LBT38_00445 [Deltaproteobacteria bacterium]|nr:hypothetical protein [Deltaproteobacteria bacterium]